MGANRDILVFKSKKIGLEELLEEVLKKSFKPQDYYEIAAILESFGWNDSRAAENFGVEDVFQLAMILWDMIKEKVVFEPFVEDNNISFFKQLILTIKSFLRGVIFALPMAISVFSMLTLRFSLWSYENLTTELATAIALGTILSFMAIGGFTQAIARRGFFYLSQNFYNIAKRITYYFIKLGYVACIVFALLFFIFNKLYQNFPFNMYIVTILYFLFLSSNWLSVTVMYILRRELTFTALISAGILIVYLLFIKLRLNIIVSQVIALVLISVLGLLLVIYYFNSAEKKLEKGIAPPLPRKSIMLYSLVPYFSYGFLYFTFLFVDRVIAWSTNNSNMPYIIWFRGQYELGIDFALLMMIIPMGFNEVIVTRLMENLEVAQKNSLSHEVNVLSSKYLKMYLNSIILAILSSIVSAEVVYNIVVYINNSSNTLIHTNYLNDPITRFVFVIALVSYSILSVALTNAVILFSLSQPEMVTKIIKLSVVIDITVGFMLTRWIAYVHAEQGYQYAIFGLLIGAIVFAAGSTRYVIKVLKNLDYYIYASL